MIQVTSKRVSAEELAREWDVQPRRVNDILRKAGVRPDVDKSYDHAAATKVRQLQIEMRPNQVLYQGRSNQHVQLGPKQLLLVEAEKVLKSEVIARLNKLREDVIDAIVEKGEPVQTLVENISSSDSAKSECELIFCHIYDEIERIIDETSRIYTGLPPKELKQVKMYLAEHELSLLERAAEAAALAELDDPLLA